MLRFHQFENTFIIIFASYTNGTVKLWNRTERRRAGTIFLVWLEARSRSPISSFWDKIDKNDQLINFVFILGVDIVFAICHVIRKLFVKIGIIPPSTEIFTEYSKNIPWKYCKLTKIFQNLSLIFLKYCNNLDMSEQNMTYAIFSKYYENIKKCFFF